MLSREARAVALALAGVRRGACVLDLAPASGLETAARAAAGPGGRVVETTAGTISHVLAVWPGQDCQTAGRQITRWAESMNGGTDGARVLVGARGTAADLYAVLRKSNWNVLHVADVEMDKLAFAVARRPTPLTRPQREATRSETIEPCLSRFRPG